MIKIMEKYVPCHKFTLVKALVTGATGFVGSYVVRTLLKAGHQVRVLRRPNSPTKLIEGLPVETAIGDVTDRSSVFEAIKGCEAVFHLAGHVSFWKGHREIQRRVNVDGTRHVVEAALAHKVKRLVHTSSIAAIGFAPEGRLGDETLPYNWWPYRIPYCDTKHLAEEEVRQGIRKGLDAVIVNPAVVFGAGDVNLHAGAMVFQMARGRLAFHFKGGCCVSDVEDVAEGHLKAFEKGRKGERYIFGGDNYSWKELFTLIAEVVGVPPPQKEIPTWALSLVALGFDAASKVTGKRPVITPESIRISAIPAYYSSEKAIRELGYIITPFRETVRKTFKWYRENGYLTINPA